MSEVGKRKFTIYDPIFQQKICVFINCAEADFLNFQRKLNVSNVDGFNPNFVGFSTHISAEGEPNTYVIWLNHFDWTLDDQESLIHEITHTVVRIWEANSIKFTPDTQEFFAHTVGRLYSMIGAKIFFSKKKGTK